MRILVDRPFEDGKNYIEAAGRSSETKPTNCITGSFFLEADTGKAYVFDETGDGTWTEIGGSKA